MFCSKCGNELRETDVFCQVCGNRVPYLTDNKQIEPPLKNKFVIPLICSIVSQISILIWMLLSSGRLTTILFYVFIANSFVVFALSITCIVKARDIPMKKGKSLGIVFTVLSSLLIVILMLLMIPALLEINAENKSVESNVVDKDYLFNYSNNYSNNSNSINKSPALIFSNLQITDFSANLGEHGIRMQCVVTNNNAFTVFGYFYVNFYDSSNNLINSQLIPLPSVSSGGRVTCSTIIPKSDYPTGYSYVDFSQATILEDNN